MRLPADVLERVRGAVVVATLATACGAEAPATTAVPPTVAPITEVALEPVDPVPYAGADEDARLARLDAEETVALATRNARIDRLASEQREAREERERISIQRLRWSQVCAGCGRG